jgi:hypothetical protein
MGEWTWMCHKSDTSFYRYFSRICKAEAAALYPKIPVCEMMYHPFKVQRKILEKSPRGQNDCLTPAQPVRARAWQSSISFMMTEPPPAQANA